MTFSLSPHHVFSGPVFIGLSDLAYRVHFHRILACWKVLLLRRSLIPLLTLTMYSMYIIIYIHLVTSKLMWKVVLPLGSWINHLD
jgi:hypothetical protein